MPVKFPTKEPVYMAYVPAYKIFVPMVSKNLFKTKTKEKKEANK